MTCTDPTNKAIPHGDGYCPVETSLIQVGLYRVHAGRAAEPHYAPHDGDPVTDRKEAEEAFIGIFRFHGEVQDEGNGVWLVELPVKYERSLRQYGYWVEGTDEYTVTAEWPL